MEPTITPPRALGPRVKPTTIGARIGIRAGKDHLFQGGLGDDVDAGGVVGLAGSFHDPLDGAELAAHLFNDRAAGLADCFHAEGGKVVGKEAADEETDNDFRIGEGEIQLSAMVNSCT